MENNNNLPLFLSIESCYRILLQAFELTLYEPTAPLCRWFTYLNSDFKRGGWSPEEDMLLCEVHQFFLQLVFPESPEFAGLFLSKLIFLEST